MPPPHICLNMNNFTQKQTLMICNRSYIGKISAKPLGMIPVTRPWLVIQIGPVLWSDSIFLQSVLLPLVSAWLFKAILHKMNVPSLLLSLVYAANKTNLSVILLCFCPLPGTVFFSLIHPVQCLLWGFRYKFREMRSMDPKAFRIHFILLNIATSTHNSHPRIPS